MGWISAEGLNKYFGDRRLFDGVTFHIAENDAVGLIGGNGTGKTTLFRILTEDEPFDGGSLSKTRKMVIGVMEQHVTDETMCAAEYVLRQFEPLRQMERELTHIATTLEQQGPDDALIVRQHVLTERFEREGGLTYRSRSLAALSGLGLSEQEQNLPVSALSGGQRSKLSLARLLVSGADLLLLDEPTNHLDMKALNWLEDFLRSSRCAYVVISHDRYFLDRVTRRTMELEHGHLTVFDGGYSAYMEHKALCRKKAQQHYEQTMREIRRLQAVVAQQRQWNREKNIKTAESKLKVIEKLEKTLKKPESLLPVLQLDFGDITAKAHEVLTVNKAGKSFEGRQLFGDVSFSVYRGETAFLLGPNGCGKTTLLKILAGLLPGDGDVRLGTGVRIGYFDQTQSNLHAEKTVLDEVWDEYPQMDQTEVRNALASFLFTGDAVFKTVGRLSGGEKARIALLKVMLSCADLLLLDEPTNHLDIRSREAVEAALKAYPGTVLAVSHDRYFINRLANKVLVMAEQGVVVCKGNLEDGFAQLEAAFVPVGQAAKQTRREESDYHVQKREKAQRRRLQSHLSRCEQELEKVGERIADCARACEDPQVACDYQKLLETQKTLYEMRQREEELTGEWVATAAELENLDAPQTEEEIGHEQHTKA